MALPYGRQLIEDDDVDAVVRALRSDFLTTGPEVEAFEAALAERTGARHAVVCSSGTAALHLAAMAARLGPSAGPAIVPSITFLATANCARYVGAEVRFADVAPDTGLMAPDEVDRLGEGAAAVLPVHLAGQLADMPEISRRARRRGLVVIEDASHAIGASSVVDGETAPVGACRHSDMCVFSFHPVKTIAMGEGGAITTNDAAAAARLRLMRNHGMTRRAESFANRELAFDEAGKPNPWYYEMAEPGFNYRATDVQCALGTSQLAKLDRFVARRAELVEAYDEALAPLAPRVRPLGRARDVRPAWHLYVALIDFAGLGRSRGDVMRALLADGVGTQVHYVPVHLQPYYRERYGAQSLPGAERYYSRALSLPLHVGMERSDVLRVVERLRAALGL